MIENKKLMRNKNILQEYIIITLFIFIGMNVAILVAHYFINSPNYLIDFVIAYVVGIPIGLFYYTILRNDETRKEYNQQRLQLEKVKNKQLETELDFLKSQYHPHFLFNALNTVYFQVDEENKIAKQTIELLSDLLRYQLYDKKQRVKVWQEIEYLNSYIQFQKLRMNERLSVEAHFDNTLNEKEIHPLLFQPLLENAFKYVGNEYWIKINLFTDNRNIIFHVENSVEKTVKENEKKGIGIENLKRRLEILYPDNHELQIVLYGNTFSAILNIKLDE
jgi:LytS/YehU family sensor histidine kinase